MGVIVVYHGCMIQGWEGPGQIKKGQKKPSSYQGINPFKVYP